MTNYNEMDRDDLLQAVELLEEGNSKLQTQLLELRDNFKQEISERDVLELKLRRSLDEYMFDEINYWRGKAMTEEHGD